jgi:putative DNA primase/helicase
VSVSSVVANTISKVIPSLDRYVEGVKGDDPFTEDALAQRFADRHADELRYVALKGNWFKWECARWCQEETLLAFELARQSIRQDKREYGNGKPPPGVSSGKTIAAVERIARADRLLAARLEQFDAADSLLNTGDS